MTWFRGRSFDQIWLVVALVLIAGGCAGNGCACVGPSPTPFPPAERVVNAVQARVTLTGVQFLQDNASSVLGALSPGGLTFPLNSCGGSFPVCCGETPDTCGPI